MSGQTTAAVAPAAAAAEYHSSIYNAARPIGDGLVPTTGLEVERFVTRRWTSGAFRNLKGDPGVHFGCTLSKMFAY